MTTLITAGQPLPLTALILAMVAAAIFAERSRIGMAITAPAMLLIGGAAVSNIGVIPLEAPLYNGVFQYLVPVAIPLLLLKADLRRIVAETGTMIIAFTLGAVYAVLGALVAVLLVDVGPEEHKLAGTLAATFIGGSLNFVAVSNALQFEDLSLVAAGLAADNVFGAGYLVLLAVVSGTAWFQHRLRQKTVDDGTEAATPSPQASTAQTGLLADVALALAISVLIVVLSNAVSTYFGLGSYSILLLTLFAVIVANLFPATLRKLRGDFELGTLCMFVFFFVIGASTDLRAFVGSAASVAVFTVIILAVHITFLYISARLLRLDLAETIIASNACIGGPATAAALAASRGWTHLVTPGLLCGIAGYVVANFIGIGLARLLAP